MTRFHKFFVQALSETILIEFDKWQKGTHRNSMGSFSFYTLNHHFQLELDQMARKRKGTSDAQTTATKTEDKAPTWVNVRFEQDEIEWITELVGNADQVGARIAQLLIEGVGFSVKFNPLRENYSAFVVGVPVAGIGENCAFSAFAPDAITAACACLCKVALVTSTPTRGTASGQSVGIG